MTVKQSTTVTKLLARAEGWSLGSWLGGGGGRKIPKQLQNTERGVTQDSPTPRAKTVLPLWGSAGG